MEISLSVFHFLTRSLEVESTFCRKIHFAEAHSLEN